MQCPRCNFENMPGLSSCARCRTVLLTASKLDVNPPRAGALKSLRPLGYKLRRIWDGPVSQPINDAVKRVTGEDNQVQWIDLLAFFAGVVPGLGHMLTGRWHEVRWMIPLWILAMGVGLYLYGMEAGIIILGAGAAVHAWMMSDAGLLRKTFGSKQGRYFFAVMLFLALFFGVYETLRYVTGFFVFGGYCSIAVPEQNIHEEDFVLMRPQAYEDREPARGDIVEVNRGHRTNHGYIPGEEPAIAVHDEEVVGEIVALPGDTVTLKQRRAYVKTPNGESYDFAMSDRFAEMKQEFMVLAGQYFFVAKYKREDADITDKKYIEWVGMLEKRHILGRAFVLYSPPWRQHWLAPQAAASGRSPAASNPAPAGTPLNPSPLL